MPQTRRAANPRHPTEAELEILRVLWSRGASTARDVHETLVAGRLTTFSTTLKLLQIMFGKGLVARRDVRRPHVYQAAIPEEKMQQQLVADLLQRAFGGAARKLVAALTASNLSDEELAEIRHLLDEHQEKSHARND